MKVLITGASGFLGRECCKQFSREGFDVSSTDKVGTVDFLGDLADTSFVDSLPHFDVIVHAAAVQYVTKGLPFFFRKKFFKINNVIATRNLCLRYCTRATHFINIGTSMMYKQTGATAYTVNSQKASQGVYSSSKLEAQAHVERLIGSATVIPCIIGGKGREGLFLGFVNLMARLGIVIYPGHGSHSIQMVHVKDVASLILLIAKRRASGWFNAGGPMPLSIREWVQEIILELKLGNIKEIAIPLAPLCLISRLTGYRLLSQEQLLMLRYPHILATDESLKLGWKPQFSNSRISRSIARHIFDSHGSW